MKKHSIYLFLLSAINLNAQAIEVDREPASDRFASCFIDDSSESLCWQQMLTEPNSAVVYDFGVHYANGDGIKQDFSKGRYWMHQAALTGFPLAQYNLGVMFFDGLGGKQSNECAVHWLNKAASESGETREMAQQALVALSELTAPAEMPKVYRVLTVKECEQLPEAVFPGREYGSAQVEDAPDGQPEAKKPPRPVIQSDEGVVIETVNVEPELSPDEPLFPGPVPESAETVAPVVQNIAPEVVEKGVPRTLNLGGALRTAPKGYYTLQLGSASQAEPMQILAKKHKLSNYLVYETERHGRRWYVLVYGEYAGMTQAKRALQQLPDTLKRNTPWIRSLAHVHTEL